MRYGGQGPGRAPQVSRESRRDLEALGFGRDTRTRATRLRRPGWVAWLLTR